MHLINDFELKPLMNIARIYSRFTQVECFANIDFGFIKSKLYSSLYESKKCARLNIIRNAVRICDVSYGTILCRMNILEL